MGSGGPTLCPGKREPEYPLSRGGRPLCRIRPISSLSRTSSASRPGLGGSCRRSTITRPFMTGAFRPGHCMLARPTERQHSGRATACWHGLQKDNIQAGPPHVGTAYRKTTFRPGHCMLAWPTERQHSGRATACWHSLQKDNIQAGPPHVGTAYRNTTFRPGHRMLARPTEIQHSGRATACWHGLQKYNIQAGPPHVGTAYRNTTFRPSH